MDNENISSIGPSWDEVRKELYTPEEIAASDVRVAIIGEIIKAREARGISQKKLEHLCGVRQPIIARMERGSTNPQLDTIIKVLAPLGKTLYVGDINQGHAPVKIRSHTRQNITQPAAAAKIPALAGMKAKKSGK